MIIDKDFIKNNLKGQTFVRGHTRQIGKPKEQEQAINNFEDDVWTDEDYASARKYCNIINYFLIRRKRGFWGNTIVDLKIIIRRFKWELKKWNCPQPY